MHASKKLRHRSCFQESQNNRHKSDFMCVKKGDIGTVCLKANNDRTVLYDCQKVDISPVCARIEKVDIDPVCTSVKKAEIGPVCACVKKVDIGMG